MTLPIVVLAGGLATRMRPTTHSIPKILIEVNGVPFLDHLLKYYVSQKIPRVVLCVGYLAEQVREFAGDGSRYGLHIDYSDDGERLLGTGGAVRNAKEMLEEHFFVQYGDTYLPIDYSEVEQAFYSSGKIALMTVFKNENRWDGSNVIFAEGTLHLYDKHNPTSEMNYIDYGLSILSKSLLEQEAKEFDLATIFNTLSRQGRLAGFEVFKRFHEIGTPEGLRETECYLSQR